MTIEKPTDGCADEVLQGAWPDYDEDLFKQAADAEFQDARLWADDAAKSAHEVRNYATQEMEGRAAEAIERKMGVDLGECSATATAHANVAGFLLMGQAAIMAAKASMKSAVAEHVSVHDALKIMIGGQGVKDADLQKARGLVATARQQLETAIDAVRVGCKAHGLIVPPGGTPKIPVAPAAEKGNVGVGNTPTAVPVKPPLGDPNSPANTNPGLTNPGAPAGTAPSAPTGSTPAGAGSSTPAATAAPIGAGAAPTTPAAPAATPGAEAGALPAASAAPTGAGQGQGSPMGMSGMPQGGMPQMQPPQMPSQTPGGDVAKTIGDTIGKVAGNNQQGTQLPAGTLDKLLEAQKDPASSSAPTAPVGEGGPNDGKDTATGTEHKPGEKTQTGTHTLGSGPKGTDVYSAENTNPALNNPASAKPSPAVPTISAAPSGVSAPVTELSSDDNPLPPANGPAGSATTLAGAGHHPGGGDSPATHTSSNGSPFATDPRNPAAAVQPPSAQGSLSAYSPGGLGPGMPIAPPPMSAGMGAAAPAPAPAAPVLAAGGAPMLAMTPAAAAVLRSAAANSGKSADPEDTGGVPRDRIAGLPAEHAVADMQLAGLMKSFASHGWAGTGIAVGVFLLEDPRPRLRYVVATSDGLSHLPIGVPAPAGLELLQHQKLNAGFASDWGGNWRAGLKLATYARSHRNCGELTYLVSNDTRDGILSPAKAGTVIEAVQTDAERTKLLEQGRVSAATMLRTQLHSPGFSDEALGKVPGWLEAFADQWGADTHTALESARARLWALRWDQRRGRQPEYPFVFVNYLILEGMKALAAGQIEEAAYVVDELVGIDHPTHLQHA
ncbi:Uncharacterised protein [Mycobacteroides abscessus subsp. abscessus]|uniref:Methyl-accepting chemotaxis sensory transducer n=2 Tax=Mycobacteroides abscessus TaxID=36809 RepID=A0AB33TDA7_9MYCO|nr:hypothetical protein [Mycobacteroides abscessus]MDO3014818.1 hypothetical protein [Mycobacteroides abscessus subsp. abscessus]MDO3086265.1 hypothetical protein [Mycobacteroides abscessus subsp. abscessus]MDO3170168.1 hypothetical protein [Mycobacteroides abscessus subsp. abscessus]OLT79227.1 hypothetical protein BKG58_20300 [Mycobacteroides abscessus subsp. abscessus]PVB10907.1 hypothetical protein DDJ68_25160 [Mycobacteroides abscessus]